MADGTTPIVGTLDRTHVRFFTRATMVEMFERAGYTVELCEGINSVRQEWKQDPSRPRRLAKLLLVRALGDARFLQFVVVAKRRSTPGLGVPE